MKKTKLTRSLLAAVSVVALSAVVYGCSSGVSDADHRAAIEAEKKAAAEAAAAAEAEKQAAIEAEKKAAEEAAAAAAEKAKMEAEEAARQAEMERLARIEAARQAIAAATTAAEAQAAKDAVNDDATATEAVGLQAAVDARIVALATMGRAEDQKMALSTAAGMIDTSDLSDQAMIDAAKAAIGGLEAALAAAADVSDADKAMYQGQVTAAEAMVATAQTALNRENQTMALSGAVAAFEDIDLTGLTTPAAIAAAQAAIDSLDDALDAATELTDAEKAAAMTLRATANRSVMAAENRVDTASQKMMLTDAVAALDMIDLDDLMTQAQIDAANEAIIELDLALAAATNLTAAEKLDATVDVTVAKRKVTAAETTLAENVGNQRMALTNAGTALGAIDLTDLDTAEKIASAKEAIEALKMALDRATHLSDDAKAMYQSQYEMADETVTTAETGMDRNERMMAQRTAITDAVTAIGTAVGAVNDTATDDEVMTADNAVAALKKAIDDAADLGEGDPDVVAARATLKALEGQLESAKTSRTAAMEKAEEERRMAEAEEERKQNEANAATAAKLYAAISPASGDGADVTAGARFADINPVSTDDPTPFISVNYGGELETAGQANSATLNLDKDTPVADHRGWKGNRYVEKDDDGNIITEARVYSDEMPTMGKKFGSAAAVTETGAFQYQLDDEGMYTVVANATGDDNPASRVGGSGFDQSAGIKEFPLPDPNPLDTRRVTVPGTFHGVSGTYSCTPTDGNTCAANRATTGFTLGLTADTDNAFTASAAAWTFKPTDPNARVTESADDMYAVYGWWLRTPAGNGAWTASAFADYYGTPVGITGLDTLNGSATYTGGAAGKYALSSSTGGDNDAGHFTARATLEADFDTEMITGTIDQFMGDGEAKDWSVALMKSGFSATGQILGAAGADDSTPMKTVWTKDGTAAAASGHWKGDFREVTTPADGGNGVPAVVTGDFYTEFGNSGKMVGGFGAKTE